MNEETIDQAIMKVNSSRAPFAVPGRIIDISKYGESYTSVTIIADELVNKNKFMAADAIRIYLPESSECPSPIPKFYSAGLQWSEGIKAPISRPLTVASFVNEIGQLRVDILSHDGALNKWLRNASLGQQISLTGSRCEFSCPDGLTDVLLIADPSGLPATISIMNTLDVRCQVHVVIETASNIDRKLVPQLDNISVIWADKGELLKTVSLLPGQSFSAVWIAAEHSEVGLICDSLMKKFGTARKNISAHPYWFAGKRITDMENKII